MTHPKNSSIKSSIELSSLCWALFSISKMALSRKQTQSDNVFNVVSPLLASSLCAFPSMTWQDLGLAADDVIWASTQLNQMFPGKIELLDFNIENSPLQIATQIYNNWLQGSGNIAFSTSGSSGSPKLVVQSCEMIEQELEGIASFFTDVRVIIALTPLHHCYAFMFAVLLHKKLGVPLKVLPPLPTLLTKELTENSLVVAFPDFWAAFSELRHPIHKGLHCLSAGSAWPEFEQKKLHAIGKLNTFEIFGSSENGCIGWRRHYEDNFCLMPYFCCPDCFAEKQNETSNEEEQSPPKDFFLERKLAPGKIFQVPVQDYLEWKSESHFMPKKRIDSAVQVSGINVYPETIAKLIQKAAGVVACKVRLMRPNEGRRLKAFIVPEMDCEHEALRKNLKKFCREQLSAPERPVKFTFGLSLPQKYGKDSDW